MTWNIALTDVSHSVPNGGRRRYLFEKLSLKIDRDTRLAVLGASGSGKSTLLGVIAGMSRPQGGVRSTTGSPPRIAQVFQNDVYLPWRTVAGNFRFAASARGRAESTTTCRVLTARILEGLSLDPVTYMDRHPSDLSGGERRRICLGMAIISQPQLLILDEANSALDEGSRFKTCDYITSTIDIGDQGLVLVTHDLEEAILMADDFLILAAEKATRVRNPLPRPRNSSVRYTAEAQKIRRDLAAEIFGVGC